MKPLTHWAIHQQQKLRLAGRSDAEIWGQLVAPDGTTRPFRYHRLSRLVYIGIGTNQQVLALDDYGFERPADKD